MKIEANRVVTLEYELTDDRGVVLEPRRTLSYLHGREQLVAGLERALEGRVAGHEGRVTVTPEDGYGVREEQRVVTMPRAGVEHEVSEGDVVEVTLRSGHGVPMMVVNVEEATITLDGNHPFAGKTLVFDVKVTEVREASAEDLDAAQ